ncbi:hypothetical protein PFISCL1PPCAC_8885, partial [Pristionchus fissidentatus]
AAAAASVADSTVVQPTSPSTSSTGIMASERIADHLEAVNDILQSESECFEAKLAENGLLILQSLLGDEGVNGLLISSMHKFTHEHKEETSNGKKALLHLGRALRAVAVARNERNTVAAGFESDHYGMPALRPIAPPLTDDKTAEQKRKVEKKKVDSTIYVALTKNEKYWGDGPVPLFYATPGNPISEPIDEENSTEALTSGPLNLSNGWEVDCSRLPPVQTERRFISDISELNMSGKKPIPRRRSTKKPLEDQFDDNGILLLKSAMTGDYETRDKLKNLKKKERRDESKKYECQECDTFFPSQQKLALHISQDHPNTLAERKQAAKKKAEKAKQLREEEKKIKEASKSPHDSNERKTRRSATIRLPFIPNLPSPPTNNKIYTCPICSVEISSQHIFASHMKHNHPKNSANESMEGRRAAVSIKKESHEAALTSSINIPSSPIDTPDRALTVLSSILTNSSEEGKTLKVKANGKYKCRVCDKSFTNQNAVAGHTRHCVKANGAAPSARAIRRRSKMQAAIDESSIDAAAAAAA